jgi:F-type H+-transporting ATPase subunit b
MLSLIAFLPSIALLQEQAEQHEAGGGLNPFDPTSFGGMLWTWVIFLVALPFMWKVVMGPIAKALEARDAKAGEAIVEAQKARDEAASARDEVTAKLAQARAEVAKELGEARSRASAIVDAAKAEAEAARERELEAARRAIAAERDKAIAAIRDEVVDLSISGARAVLQRNVGGEDDRRMVADLVGNLKTVKQ